MVKKEAIVAISIFLAACSSEPRQTKEIRELFGRQIEFVEGYEYVNNQCLLSDIELIDNHVKMVSYIEDFSCTDCMFNMLKVYSDEVRDIDKTIDYVFVISSDNREEIVQGLQAFQIDRPVFHYLTDIFKKANKLDVLARNRTFLLNAENKIVAVGEPFGNPKVKEFYQSVLQKMTSTEQNK